MATPNIQQTTVVPARPDEVMAQILRVSGADRYQPVGQSLYGLTLHRRRIPIWAVVLAIVFFPFGLLFLLAKKDENVAVELASVAGGTQVTIAGQASPALQRALEYALAGNRPTAAGLPVPTAPPSGAAGPGQPGGPPAPGWPAYGQAGEGVPAVPQPAAAPDPATPPAAPQRATPEPAAAGPAPPLPSAPPAYAPPAPPAPAPPSFAPPPPPPLAAPPGGQQQPPTPWAPPLPPAAPGGSPGQPPGGEPPKR